MSPDNSQKSITIDQQQAIHLADLARNGSGGGYPGVAANHLSNGPTNEYNELDTAALLESLAEFNTASSAESRTPVANDHFASLLQAAATAGGQEIARANHDPSPAVTPSPDKLPPAEFFHRSFPPPNPTSKRKRNRKHGSQDEGEGDVGLISTKRQRKPSPPEDPELVAQEQEIWGPEEDEDNGSERISPVTENHAHPNFVGKVAGVHSAAALFRRPTAASRKYTRAPMSKLFLSLELEPEDFLDIQAAAKAYMLDPEHLERRDCVGGRVKGDTDHLKLKLFACVQRFLEVEGWGPKLFSATAKGGDRRKNKWPQHRNKIITLVTPLLRRMVTNERQRVYALTTRKTEPNDNPTPGLGLSGSADPQTSALGSSPCMTFKTSPYPVDPSLDQYHYNPEQSFTSDIRDSLFNDPIDGNNRIEWKCQVNILRNGRRIKQPYILAQASCADFSALCQSIDGRMSPNSHISEIKVMTPAGLVLVEEETAWSKAMALIAATEWMDGEVKVLVSLDG